MDLMKLNTDLIYGKDYSEIAFALFIKENHIDYNRKYDFEYFAKFLYRFYLDIKKAR